MASIICTLFEKHYHYGVGVLANSLWNNGYRGAIYAGYRGELPAWASAAKPDNSFVEGTRSLSLAEGLELFFVPLNTDYHLTNYKPDFMLQLMEGLEHKPEGVFYLDPDIVVTYDWAFFEEWVQCGVALCEDVNSPLPEFNPRRSAWRKYFGEHGIQLNFKSETYVNGGFVGVKREDIGFLTLWKQLQEVMAPLVGGLKRSALTGTPLPQSQQGAFAPFGKTDQDALNSAVEAWEGKVSFIGKEAMALKPGKSLLPHALGQPKPWHFKPLAQALRGFSPRQVDKDFWINAEGPAGVYSSGEVFRKKVSLKIASLIGRFYTRQLY